MNDHYLVLYPLRSENRPWPPEYWKGMGIYFPRVFHGLFWEVHWLCRSGEVHGI